MRNHTMTNGPASGDGPGNTPERNLVPHFFAFMALYLAAVHFCSLTIHPLGRDYAAMADPQGMPWMAGLCFRAEMHVFGSFIPGYHLVNLTLLYAGMAAVFFLTRHIVRGPWWLGSLAATLMMANPLKSEAVLNLSGVSDLLPASLALIALALYSGDIARHRFAKQAAALVLLAAASWCFPRNAMLFLVCLLAEWLTAEPGERRTARIAFACLIGVVALGLAMKSPLQTLSPNPMLGIAPLFFVFYPIGLLPETVGLFQTCATAGVMLVLVLLLGLACRRTPKRRPMLFALLAACAFQLFQGNPEFDLVHLLGGGALLVPIALMNIALAAFCRPILLHRKWLRPMVFVTSVLCLVFFGLQFRAVLLWHYAGKQVHAFQHVAAACQQEHPGVPLGVLPDYDRFLGAPMMLSESIVHKTPFNDPIRVYRLFPISRHPGQTCQITLQNWSEKEGAVCIGGVNSSTRPAYPLADRYRCYPWSRGPVPVSSGPLYVITSSTSEKQLLRFDSRRFPLPPIIPFTPEASWLF